MFFFLFLITDLNILISAVNKQIFNPSAKLIISIEIPTKKSKTEMEPHPVSVKINISKCTV